MINLQWSAFARADLLAIVNYISDDNADAAQRVFDDIRTKTDRLIDFPLMGRVGRIKGTRELVILGNYIVVYREDGSQVLVLRVMHSAQQFP